jgi:hypothetical protein
MKGPTLLSSATASPAARRVIAAHDAGATVLLLEKGLNNTKDRNSRANAQIVFRPNDFDKARTYFEALDGAYRRPG